MESQPREEDIEDLQEAAEEEELVKLEEEVEQMAKKILDCRTTLPPQFTAIVSSLLQSQRPVLPTHLLDGAQPENQLPDGQGVARETNEGEKIKLLKQKMSSNAAAMPAVLSRMKEYMGRIDKLDSSNKIIPHPAFNRKPTA